jgi:hypothetical protein
VRLCPVDAVGCSDTGVVGGGGIELLVPFLALAVVIAIVAYVLVRRQRR